MGRSSSTSPTAAACLVAGSLFWAARSWVLLGVVFLSLASSSSSESCSSSSSCTKPGSSGMKGMVLLPMDRGAGNEAAHLSTTNERMVTSLIVRRTSPVVLMSTQYSLTSFSYLSCLAMTSFDAMTAMKFRLYGMTVIVEPGLTNVRRLSFVDVQYALMARMRALGRLSIADKHRCTSTKCGRQKCTQGTASSPDPGP